jgi:3-oxoacyl-[acyl-carrier-protein] synthase II
MARVVITGIGLVTPLGIGAASNWNALCAGRSGVTRLARFDTSRLPVRIAGEVHSLEAKYVPERRVAKMCHLSAHYAAAAVALALEDARLALETVDRRSLGIAMASGEVGMCYGDFTPAVQASFEDGAFSYRRFATRGTRHLDPYFVLRALPTNGLCYASIAHQATGPTVNTASASAAGAQALGEAMRIIQEGEAEVMIAGAYDSLVLPSVLLHHYNLGALADGDGDPAAAVRPFDRTRAGYVLAEGAGVAVLESATHAQRRGATALAEIAGYGLGFDPVLTPGSEHGDPSAAEARGTARAVRHALRDADIEPEDVDLMKLEGEATVAGDRAEWRGVTAALGRAAATIPVWALKGAWGHQGAAGGVSETLATAIALHAGMIPPTRNFTAADPNVTMTVVRGVPRAKAIHHALAVSRGFGGQSAALVLRACPNGALEEGPA